MEQDIELREDGENSGVKVSSPPLTMIVYSDSENDDQTLEEDQTENYSELDLDEDFFENNQVRFVGSENHILVNAGEQPECFTNICEDCNLAYPSEEALLKHKCIMMNDYSDNQNPEYDCFICQTKFNERADLQNHFQEAHKDVKNVYHCLICDEYLSSTNEHFGQESLSDASCYLCSLCDEISANLPEHKHHFISSHMSEGFRYACRLCPKGSNFFKYLGLDDFKDHFMEKHPENIEWDDNNYYFISENSALIIASPEPEHSESDNSCSSESMDTELLSCTVPQCIIAERSFEYDFVCQSCRQMSFPTQEELVIHIMTMHSDFTTPMCSSTDMPINLNSQPDPVGFYVCERCPDRMIFPTLKSYQEHTNEMHIPNIIISKANTDRYACQRCPEKIVFDYEEDLLKHLIEVHAKETPNIKISQPKRDRFVCERCPEKVNFNYKEDLLKHLIETHARKPASNQESSSKQTPQITSKVDTFPGYPCKRCPIKGYFPTKESLLEHLLTVHVYGTKREVQARKIEMMQEVDSMPNTQFSKTLEYHPCERCPVKTFFSSKESLLGHLLAVHAHEKAPTPVIEEKKLPLPTVQIINNLIDPKIPAITISHTKKVGSFACERCPIISYFPSKESLMQHLLKLHVHEKHFPPPAKTSPKPRKKTERPPKKVKERKPKKPAPWVCQICPESFRSKRALKGHVADEHEKQLTCLKCSKKFQSQRIFDSHKWQCEHIKHIPDEIKSLFSGEEPQKDKESQFEIVVNSKVDPPKLKPLKEQPTYDPHPQVQWVVVKTELPDSEDEVPQTSNTGLTKSTELDQNDDEFILGPSDSPGDKTEQSSEIYDENSSNFVHVNSNTSVRAKISEQPKDICVTYDENSKTVTNCDFVHNMSNDKTESNNHESQPKNVAESDTRPDHEYVKNMSKNSKKKTPKKKSRKDHGYVKSPSSDESDGTLTCSSAGEDSSDQEDQPRPFVHWTPSQPPEPQPNEIQNSTLDEHENSGKNNNYRLKDHVYSRPSTSKETKLSNHNESENKPQEKGKKRKKKRSKRENLN